MFCSRLLYSLALSSLLEMAFMTESNRPTNMFKVTSAKQKADAE